MNKWETKDESEKETGELFFLMKNERKGGKKNETNGNGNNKHTYTYLNA